MLSSLTVRRRSLRPFLLGLALVAGLSLLAAAGLRFAATAPIYIDDYIVYWSAGRLNAAGQDPYGEASLRAVQATLDPAGKTYGPFHYTPWALPLLMPFGLLDYGASRALWTVLSLLGFALLCRGLWLLYGGPPRRAARGLALGFTLVPALMCLGIGQVTWLILASAAGFVYFAERRPGRGHWLIAGACVAVVGIKPQLLYLFWPAALLWIVENRRWSLLLGGVIAGLVGTGAAWAANPAVLGQYLAVDYASFLLIPTPSAALRLVLAPGAGWLQAVPAACGLAWFLLYYWPRHRRTWRWSDEMPLLVLVCLATAPVVWVYDYILLLLPITAIFARLGEMIPGTRGRAILAVYAAIDVLILISPFVVQTKHLGYIWAPPALLVWYLAARRFQQDVQHQAPAGEGACGRRIDRISAEHLVHPE